MKLPKLEKTFSSNLEVFDVSSMLYVQTSMTGKILNNSSIKKGVNVAGMSFVLNRIAYNYSRNIRTALAMDSFSDRKNLSAGFKSNRVFHPEISVQADIITQYFSDFGVEVLKKPGREADDLIYSIVNSNVNNFASITVYTGDRDIYGCIIDPSVKIVGTSSTRPSLSVFNYETACDSKEKIVYNTVLPYTMLFGKASNALPALHASVPNKKIYSAFLDWYEKKGYNKAEASFESVFIEFACASSDGLIDGLVFTNSDIEMIIERLPLVYPVLDDIPLEQVGPEIDVEKLLQFLNFYQQYPATEKFGLNNFVQLVTPPTQMNTMLKRLYSTLKTGTLAADNHLSADVLPMPVNATSEFLSIEGW